MNKIVIITNNSEKENGLIKCLSVLFPECEIEIKYKQAEGFEDFPLHMKED